MGGILFVKRLFKSGGKDMNYVEIEGEKYYLYMICGLVIYDNHLEQEHYADDFFVLSKVISNDFRQVVANSYNSPRFSIADTDAGYDISCALSYDTRYEHFNFTILNTGAINQNLDVQGFTMINLYNGDVSEV